MPETEKFAEDERQLYHFHFPAAELYQDFRQLARNEIQSELSNLEQVLVAKFPEKADTIGDQMMTVSNLCLDSAEEPLEQFQSTVKDIFKLPADVVIPYLVSTKHQRVTPEELEALRTEVEELETEYIQEKSLAGYLNEEKVKFEKLQPLYDETEKTLQFYKDSKRKCGEKSVQELMGALKVCDEAYEKKKAELVKEDVVDESGLFEIKD